MRQALPAVLFCLSAAHAGDIRMATDFLPLPFTPGITLTGDANADGRTDLYLFTTNPNAVTIYFGREDAGFDPGPTYPLPANPLESVHLADLNANGRADIVLLDRFNDTIHILPADTEGAYETQIPLPTIAQPRTIALGDTDADGMTDIIVARGNLAAVHRNLGDLAFDAPAEFPITGGIPISILAIDILGNGNPELAFLATSPNALRMYRNGPDGYTLVHTANLPSTPIAMTAADTFGIGANDILIAYRLTTGISVLRSPNNISYSLTNQPLGTASETTATTAAFADISGNNRPDVLHGFEGNQLLRPVYRTAVGSSPLFRQSEPPIARLSNLRHAHLADLNNDGRTDLLLIGDQPPGILAMPQHPAGTFRSSGQILETAQTYRTLLPIPGHTNPSAFVGIHSTTNAPLLRVEVQPQLVGFAITQTPIDGTLGESSTDWMFVDVNANGRPDLVRRASNSIRWQLAAPDGSFGLALERALGTVATGIVSADFDADGTADFVWFNTDGRARIAHGRVTGFISPPYELDLAGFENLGVLAAADMNNDGIPDLIFTDRTADGPRLHVALARGDATFHPPVTVPTIPRINNLTPNRIAIGDFTRNGRPDIVVAGVEAIALHPTDPDGIILEPEIIPIGPGITGVTAVDLNASRRPELIVSRGSGHAEILASVPGAPLSVRRSFYTPVQTLGLAYHDLDNDGLPDLIAGGPDGITIIRNHSTPACIPDFVPDGSLDFFDVAEFLRAFNAGDPAADLNDDGNLDFFDLAEFFRLYNKGCP